MKMHLTLFVLSALASSVLGKEKKAVGFYILGAHRTRLRYSMEQRIDHAVSLAQSKHSEDQHIYFVSGTGCCKSPDKDPGSNRCVSEFCNGKKKFCKTEAQHMNDRILQLYQDWPSKPQVEMDHEAMFTVMNFLKTIPLINKRCKELDMVYMITSDYHIPRSQAILDEFVKQGLCKVEIRASGAPHPGFDMDKWRAQVDEYVFEDKPLASVEKCVDASVEGFDKHLTHCCAKPQKVYYNDPLHGACCAKPHQSDYRHPVLGWMCTNAKEVGDLHVYKAWKCTNANKGKHHVYKEAGSGRLKTILDPIRDRSNAAIFAKLCRYLIDANSRDALFRGTALHKFSGRKDKAIVRLIRKDSRDIASGEATASAEDLRNEQFLGHFPSMAEQYCKNNDAKTAEVRAEKVKQLRDLCGEFAASFEPKFQML